MAAHISKMNLIATRISSHIFLSIKASSPGKSLYRGKGMVPHVQWSKNWASKINLSFFFALIVNFFCRLTTAQAVDSLPLYRDFAV